MLTERRLQHYRIMLESPDRIPASLLLEAIQAVGGFYTGTQNAGALRVLRKIVELTTADHSTRVIAYVHMLEVGAIPIDEYPSNVMEIDLTAVQDSAVFKRLCLVAAKP